MRRELIATFTRSFPRFDCVSRAPEFMVAKKLVALRTEVDADRLADESVPLKALLEQQHV